MKFRPLAYNPTGAWSRLMDGIAFRTTNLRRVLVDGLSPLSPEQWRADRTLMLCDVTVRRTFMLASLGWSYTRTPAALAEALNNFAATVEPDEGPQPRVTEADVIAALDALVACGLFDESYRPRMAIDVVGDE